MLFYYCTKFLRPWSQVVINLVTYEWQPVSGALSAPTAARAPLRAWNIQIVYVYTRFIYLIFTISFNEVQ